MVRMPRLHRTGNFLALRSVSVPVLSKTMVSALANDSKYFAPLTMTPILAASLIAVITATEPVSLSAHE